MSKKTFTMRTYIHLILFFSYVHWKSYSVFLCFCFSYLQSAKDDFCPFLLTRNQDTIQKVKKIWYCIKLFEEKYIKNSIRVNILTFGVRQN